MHKAMRVETSVVVASHRPHYITACIDALVTEAVSETEREIIVVADYPIEQLAKEHPGVQWICMPDISIPAKRNRGISCAHGEVVGFTDDDCIPRPGWVKNAAAFLRRNNDCAGVAGQTDVEHVEASTYPLREFKRLELPGWRTNNIFYRKSDLIEAGCFDERFTLQREDADVAFSILARGRKIGYCSDVKVLHRHRNGERWDLLKNCRNRQFDPLLYKKHRRAYRSQIGTPMPPAIALMLLAHLALGACWFAGNPAFGIAAVVSGVYAVGLSLRRNELKPARAEQIVCDAVSYVIAPYVLLAALIYGSVKCRSLLLY